MILEFNGIISNANRFALVSDEELLKCSHSISDILELKKMGRNYFSGLVIKCDTDFIADKKL